MTTNALPQSAPEWLQSLIVTATERDGHPPFSDHALLEYASGARRILTVGSVAAALVSDTEAELVVHPDSRKHGIGRELLEKIVDTTHGDVAVWAHGDHPGARAVAARLGFEPTRELLRLRGSTTAPEPDRVAEPFRVGVNEREWIILNARVFVAHPEQGKITLPDLLELEKQPWFDPENFLLIRDGETLVGYCWLKVAPSTGELYIDSGELYAVGVDPLRQGEGYGRSLVLAGLARLRTLGIPAAFLYVEADNVAARALYEGLGFTIDATDVQYRPSLGGPVERSAAQPTGAVNSDPEKSGDDELEA